MSYNDTPDVNMCWRGVLPAVDLYLIPRFAAYDADEVSGHDLILTMAVRGPFLGLN